MMLYIWEIEFRRPKCRTHRQKRTSSGRQFFIAAGEVRNTNLKRRQNWVENPKKSRKLSGETDRQLHSTAWQGRSERYCYLYKDYWGDWKHLGNKKKVTAVKTKGQSKSKQMTQETSHYQECKTNNIITEQNADS